ncbi:MAG: hydantoinase/oxoprolinase family protein [Actinomycetia bacterium]|nr:hydantoinase/oxoprolinase family protein [Actinomycetes bacterium]MCP3911998.1 hydantoinase/oxoprolinase family protein [Actinomycetes bacterium]MCP4083503.1 hydantoinase/oxoprolinase family protein [Actinomycetes bacterium]
MSRRIGIDVGGTNTDAALVEGSEVVAATKATTTDDVLGGITAALAGVPHADVAAVVIGTTHFTNAVVQRRALNRVGFLRLGLPAGQTVRPLCDWPTDLAAEVHGATALVEGGTEFDGRPFMPLDETAVEEAARRFGDDGIDSIVVTGSFSPVDSGPEERAAEIVESVLPDAAITLSSRLGRLGLLERENAAGLNACLIHLARHTIEAFGAALTQAGFGPDTRLYLTQNDGTLLSIDEARSYPVLTFASGPTNSMRGAARLAGVTDGIVVDVGGTTADFGALVAGYPRQANAAVDVGGVRTLFRLPDLESIGLGGGSIVGTDPLSIGPDSVGQHLVSRARSFGGDTLTLTDAAVSSGRLTIAGADPVGDGPDPHTVLDRAAAMIADGADRMKLSGADTPLVAVGGGAFAVPDSVPGFEPVVRPPHAGVANAVGAALAQVSGEVDRVFRDLGHDGAIAEATRIAVERAETAGAVPGSAEPIEVEDLPLAYLPGDARRVRVRVIGRLGS